MTPACVVEDHWYPSRFRATNYVLGSKSVLENNCLCCNSFQHDLPSAGPSIVWVYGRDANRQSVDFTGTPQKKKRDKIKTRPKNTERYCHDALELLLFLAVQACLESSLCSKTKRLPGPRCQYYSRGRFHWSVRKSKLDVCVNACFVFLETARQHSRI